MSKLRRLLSPLSWLFAGATQIRRKLYKRGVLRSYFLDGPVISVGNISLGGTGKTPTVAYLAELARRWGNHPVILSRGYKGAAESSGLLVANGDGPLCRPSDCGDEPYLLARLVPFATILVGKNRRSAAEKIQGHFDNPIYLLDDGFQHLSIRRHVDLLLIDATNPFGNGHVLPAGNLREPKSAIDLADAVIFTRTHLLNLEEIDSLEQEVRRWNREAPIFHFDHSPEIAYELIRQKHIPLRGLAGREFLVLAALGNPHQFVRDVKQMGLKVADHFFFRDHHPYSKEDLQSILKKLEVTEAEGVVTTEKDAVRLADLDLPVDTFFVLRIQMKCRQEDAFHDWLRSRLEEGSRD